MKDLAYYKESILHTYDEKLLKLIQSENCPNEIKDFIIDLLFERNNIHLLSSCIYYYHDKHKIWNSPIFKNYISNSYQLELILCNIHDDVIKKEATEIFLAGNYNIDKLKNILQYAPVEYKDTICEILLNNDPYDIILYIICIHAQNIKYKELAFKEYITCLKIRLNYIVDIINNVKELETTAYTFLFNYINKLPISSFYHIYGTFTKEQFNEDIFNIMELKTITNDNLFSILNNSLLYDTKYGDKIFSLLLDRDLPKDILFKFATLKSHYGYKIFFYHLSEFEKELSIEQLSFISDNTYDQDVMLHCKILIDKKDILNELL